MAKNVILTDTFDLQCSGGLPCDRCSKKNVKCEYAQLDKKRKIKTTTSEQDMSGGSGNKGTTSTKNKGGSCDTAASNGKSRLAKKSNKSTKSIMAADYEEVPLDLESSPFTPISLLYQKESEEERGGDGDGNALENGITLPEFSAGIPSHPSMELKRLGQDEWSPSSSTSQTSSDIYANGPAPEAIQSPRPFYWTPRSSSFRPGSPAPPPPPSGTQESAFRRSHLSSQTSFF